MEPDLSLSLAGIPMRSPVVLLSGCVGFGEDLLRLEGFDFTHVGAICLKGTTLEPKRGNAPHRIAETPSGMLNAIGLQNPGVHHVVKVILPRIAMFPTRLIANVAGSTVEEYVEVARYFDQSPVDGIEINISCPNVKQGGAAFGADPVVAAQIVRGVKQSTCKPVITKLSPNVTDIAAIARAVIDAGTDALSVINTVMGMTVDWRSGRPALGNLSGGLSGPAIKPIALLKVWQVYQVARERRIPIIGQGGISTAEDALEFARVGATAVGVGTALFRDPFVADSIAAGLRLHLKELAVNEWVSLVGTLKLNESKVKGN